MKKSNGFRNNPQRHGLSARGIPNQNRFSYPGDMSDRDIMDAEMRKVNAVLRDAKPGLRRDVEKVVNSGVFKKEDMSTQNYDIARAIIKDHFEDQKPMTDKERKVHRKVAGVFGEPQVFAAPQKSGRVTVTKGGNRVKRDKWDSKKGNYLNLGKSVPDKGEPGFDTVADVRNDTRASKEALQKGYIDRKTFNARTLRAKAIVEQTKKGELADNNKKVKAIMYINDYREDVGMGPLDTSPKPPRPTPKQDAASTKTAKTLPRRDNGRWCKKGSSCGKKKAAKPKKKVAKKKKAAPRKQTKRTAPKKKAKRESTPKRSSRQSCEKLKFLEGRYVCKFNRWVDGL